jgi:alpha-amylase
MIPVCLYFQVHQPYRLRRYGYFDVGREHDYFDAAANSALILRVAEKCYLPAAAMLGRLLGRHEGFRAAFSLSGCVVEQLAAASPETLDAFRALVETGRVEILAETSHHSLAWLASRDEFLEQVEEHAATIAAALGAQPRVFRNTELIYCDDLARVLASRGYAGVLADGVPVLLGDRSPHFLYSAGAEGAIPVLPRDARMSDDIAFRFSDPTWAERPLTPEKYAGWVSGLDGDILSLFMDFETFGEHQWRETGIFEFFEGWIDLHVSRGGEFLTPSEAIATLPSAGSVSAPRPVSWADAERDLSAWQGNALQRDALVRLFELESGVRASGRADLRSDFRRLTTSDHYYYMATKAASDGDVHAYFSPYESPFEAYMTFMHVVADLAWRLTGARPRPSWKPLGPDAAEIRT